ERVVAILSQVLAALAVAHDIGVVHRDLKPENVLVLAGADDDGLPIDVVKVCDFGVAKLAARAENESAPFSRHLTVDGVAIGTPDYMSPEQARGESVDGRSDLYSVGVVLYHLIAGRTPFVGDSPLGIALQQVSDDPPLPSHFRDVHSALEAICLRAMDKRPADRFQTARDMRRALRSAVRGAARTSCSTPPLVLTRAWVPTPRYGSHSPSELAAVVARPTKRRRAGSRVRQGAWASVVGAVLAYGVAGWATPLLESMSQRVG